MRGRKKLGRTKSTSKSKKGNKQPTAAKGSLETLSCRDVRGGTLGLKALSNGLLVGRVNADTRGVGAEGGGESDIKSTR